MNLRALIFTIIFWRPLSLFQLQVWVLDFTNCDLLYFGLNFTRYTQKMKTFVYSNLLPKVLKRPPNSIPVPFIDSEKLAKRDGHKDPHLSSAFKAGLFCGFSQWKPEFWHRTQNLTLKAFEAIKEDQRLKGNFHTSLHSGWTANFFKNLNSCAKNSKKLYSLRSQFSKMRQFPGFFQHCDVSIVVNSEVSNRAFNTIDADDTQVVLFFLLPKKSV